MFNKFELSLEEKFLINILFKKDKILIKDFEKINYEILVKKTSSHLMLPSLFVKLRDNDLIKFIPKDLSNYLSEIYKLNLERNKLLVSETRELSRILNENGINHTFLKGSAMILGEFFQDIGERMIGDIDILVAEDQINTTSNLLKSKGYEQVSKYYFFNQRHAPRLKNKNKLFSVEIHRRLVDKDLKKKLSTKIILKNKSITNDNISLIDEKFILLHCIYNYMLNDYGSDNLTYSYKTFYDINRILTKYPSLDKNIFTDIFLKKNIIMSNLLGISDFEIKYDLKLALFNYKFVILNKYRTINIINRLVYKLIRFTKTVPTKIWEFFKNSSYRKYVFLKMTGNL